MMNRLCGLALFAANSFVMAVVFRSVGAVGLMASRLRD